MAGLVKSLGNLVWKKKEERLIIFGNDYSGKTTLLYRLKLGETVTTIPTIGFNVETIQHKGWAYTLWDVGGCDKIRPLWRHYVSPETSILYVHNCGNDAERIPESFEGMHQNIELMLDVGAKFIWVLFTKQDLLSAEQRSGVVNDLRQRFEQELSPYKEKGIVFDVLDLPGFSALSGEQVSNLLPAIHSSLETQRKTLRANDQQASKYATPPSDMPTPLESELIARIGREGVDEMEAESFWKAFLSCEIREWNHRSHLRAGYITLLETLKDGKGIFDAADTFLEHLTRLKEAKPERFRNTEHRSMTIFWLYHLQLAILSFKHDENFEKWPAWADFQDVLLNSPQLMDGGLWKTYFSKELLFSPEAKEYWRLPDLQALPDLAQTSPSKLKQHIRRNSQEEPYRVMRLAFSVVQKYMSSNVRRGLVVKQALASLQSTTMRLRAKNSTIPPYSETQAYFWIQLIHAALASETSRAPTISSTKELSLHVPLHQLSFSSFRVLFDMEPTLWKKYYTHKTWESVEARMSFVNPDIKPLPDIISIPSSDNISRAMSRQLDNAHLGTAAELPSMEDLAFRAAMVLEDTKNSSQGSTDIADHAHLLLFLYNHLVVTPETASSSGSTANKAASVMMQLSGSYIPSLTLKSFWTQQVLGTTLRDRQASSKSSSSNSPPTFEGFLKENLHLVYEDLPLCYYSPELLQSLDAKETFVAPDKRKMRGFFPIEEQEQEDDWVVL